MKGSCVYEKLSTPSIISLYPGEGQSNYYNVCCMYSDKSNNDVQFKRVANYLTRVSRPKLIVNILRGEFVVLGDCCQSGFCAVVVAAVSEIAQYSGTKVIWRYSLCRSLN